MITPHSPIELKIKAASMAAEARIIRNLEKRLKRAGLFAGKHAERRRTDFFNIQFHRRFDVRLEARATHLARTFLKGQPYSIVEQSHSTPAPFKRASEIATKYSKDDKRIVAQGWQAWQDAACVHRGTSPG